MISRAFSCRFFSAVVLGLSNVAVTAQTTSARPLEIYFIDVEGGAATLLVTPDRESILIDSGWPGHDDRDPNRIVHVLKDLARCDHLDHLITTHWHMDHFGGVAGFSGARHDRHFWDRGAAGDADARPDFRRVTRAADPPESPTARRPAGASGKLSMPAIRCRSPGSRPSFWRPAGR